MIVELTGCSGAGKTTLLEQIVEHCRERNVAVMTVPQMLLKPVPAPFVHHPTIQNLLLDAAAAFRRAVDPARYRSFLAFARAVIRRDSDCFLTGLNAYRGVLRALGVHAGLSRRAQSPIVLVDEGTIHQAHNILVHVERPARHEDIDSFGKLVPVPDVIVYLSAPLEVVLARTSVRQDPPLRLRSREENRRYVEHGHAMFAALISHEAFSGKVVSVNCDEDRRQYRQRASEIVQSIA